jgi:hypothetical protein
MLYPRPKIYRYGRWPAKNFLNKYHYE